MSDTKQNFGRPYLRELVKKAGKMGIAVSFHTDMDGKYVVETANGARRPPNAASACHFVMGMIDVKTPSTTKF